jgi:hypothetical protein
VDVLIVIGDQDTYHDVDHDVVSSPIWLADVLDDEGVVGLFVLHARRAEILAEQRRYDVIAALRRHEIGLHGRDVHPVVPEIVEGLAWDEGVVALEDVEGSELATLGRVFDVTPVCSSQHRNYWAPQLHGVARRLGLPYLFGPPCAPPFHSVSWYGGALNVPFNAPVPDFLGSFPQVFDDALPDDEAFERMFGALQDHVARSLEVGLPLLVVFTCHPERLCYRGPLEIWRYGNGRNHPTTVIPPGVEVRRSRAAVDRALANFRQLVRYLRDTPGLAPTTVHEMTRRYGQQPATISSEDLARFAERAVITREIPLPGATSPAEALLGFAEALVRWESEETLPIRVARHDILGPRTAPPRAPEVPGVTKDQLVGLARGILDYAGETGHLPSELMHDSITNGQGVLYGTFATAFHQIHRGDTLDGGIALEPWPRYPVFATALGERQHLCLEDPLVRPDLSIEAAALHARLQTWTLKAAMRS